MLTCEIPYIDNSNNTEEVKEELKNKHLSAVNALKSFTDFKLETKRRFSTIDEESVSYYEAPSIDRMQELKDHLNNNGSSGNYIGQVEREVGGKTKKILVIDVTGGFFEDITLKDSDLFSSIQDYNSDTNSDVEALLDNNEVKGELYKLFAGQKDRLEVLKNSEDPLTKRTANNLLSSLKEETFLMKASSATWFLRNAINFTKYFDNNYSKEFFKSELNSISKLETFEERKIARGALAKEVDVVKNKLYMYGKIKEAVDLIKLDGTFKEDVFESYNKYRIVQELLKLEELSTLEEEDVLEELEGTFENVEKLNEQITLRFNLKLSQAKEITSKSVYKSLIGDNGEIQKSLSQEIVQARDDMHRIQDTIHEFMIDAQTDLLYDTYLEYLPQAETAYAKKHSITKEKLRENIKKANGNISVLSWQLKHGDEIPDDVIALFHTLLTRTSSEIDYENFNKTQQIIEDFKDFNQDELDRFNKESTTYTFDLVNSFNQESFFEKDGKLFSSVTINGVEEVKEFELPKPTMYGRYYQLEPGNDNMWVYRSDFGTYHRVMATKALKGLNTNHRIKIEEILLNQNIDDMVEAIYSQNDNNFTVYGQDVTVKTLTLKSIKYKIREAFNNLYKGRQDTISELENNKSIFKKYTKEKSSLEKEKILKDSFIRRDAHNRQSFEDFLFSDNHYSSGAVRLQDGDSLNETTLLAQLNTGEVVPIRPQGEKGKGRVHLANLQEDGTYSLGKQLDITTIDFYFTVGNNLKPNLVDDVITDTLLQDERFQKFYQAITKEYLELEKNDATGYLVDGKLGQTRIHVEKGIADKIRNLKDKGVEGVASDAYKSLTDSFFKDNDEFVDLIDINTGKYVDHKGNVLPEGAKPIKVRRKDYNIDRLEYNDLTPNFAKRQKNQFEVTPDLLTNILAMSQEAVRYNKMQHLEPQMRFALILNEGSPELNISGRGSSDFGKNNKYTKFLNGSAESAKRNLQFIIKAFFYDDPIFKDSLGRQTFEPITNKLRSVMHFQTLAFNLTANGRNLATGQFNAYLSAASKKHGLTESDWHKGRNEVTKLMGSTLAGTVGHISIKDGNYIVKLASMFNAIAGLTVEDKTFTEKKSWRDYLSYKTLFLGSSAGEVLNQVPLMLGYMRSYKIPGMNGYTMYDALRINGETIKDSSDIHGVVSLVDPNNNPIPSNIISMFSANLNDILSESQGDYGKNQKVQAQGEYLPSLALTYIKWLYPNLRKRFSRGQEFNLKTGEQELSGYQRTFLKNMFMTSNDLKELLIFNEGDTVGNKLKEIGKTVIPKVALSLPSLLVSVGSVLPGVKKLTDNEFSRKIMGIKEQGSEEFFKMFNLEQLENETDEEFKDRTDKLYEKYTNALDTASKEYAVLLALIIVGTMLQALNGDDDDENNRIIKFLEVQSEQLVSDLSLGTPLIAPLKGYDFFSQRAKDPFLLLRTINNNARLAQNIFGFQINPGEMTGNLLINDVYDKSGPSYEKGDLKIVNNLEKSVFSPIYQVHKMFTPEEQQKYSKMINKSAIITDKDFSETEGELEEE